jgi:chromosome condensin MukBEF ATPase and DNA-binding subunit MukB
MTSAASIAASPAVQGDEGADGFKRLTFRGFEAQTVEAIRELRAEKEAHIEALESRLMKVIKEQQEQITELRKDLESLRSGYQRSETRMVRPGMRAVWMMSPS